MSLITVLVEQLIGIADNSGDVECTSCLKNTEISAEKKMGDKISGTAE